MASFPTASQAREQAQNYSVISGEVQAIETAIIAAISANSFKATVTNGTTMTDFSDSTLIAQSYFNAFKGTVPNVVFTEQMNEVIKHFTDKGYAIERVTATAQAADTFFWSVVW